MTVQPHPVQVTLKLLRLANGEVQLTGPATLLPHRWTNAVMEAELTVKQYTVVEPNGSAALLAQYCLWEEDAEGNLHCHGDDMWNPGDYLYCPTCGKPTAIQPYEPEPDEPDDPIGVSDATLATVARALWPEAPTDPPPLPSAGAGW